jgi:hypothetical protein
MKKTLLTSHFSLLILLALASKIFALDVTVSSKHKEWSQNDSSFLLMASVFTNSTSPQQRDPLQVLYLMDVSERFAGNVRQEFINGGIELVKRLADTDFFGIVIYSGYSRTLLPISEIGSTGRERIYSLLSETGTERGRDPLSALDRVVSEFSQNQGRRSDGRTLVMSVLGETLEDGNGNYYDKKFVEEMKKFNISIFTMGHGDDFEEDAAISAAEATGGRAYFVGRDRTDMLKSKFDLLTLKIIHPHTKDIRVNFLTRDGIQLGNFGEAAVLNEVNIPRISANDTVNLFIEATNRPRRSTDIDIDYEYLDIAMRADLSGTSAFKINLSRGSSAFDAQAPKIIKFQILFNMVNSIDQIKIGDKAFRRNYADGFRRLLETRLGNIRNEINTREIQQVFVDMVALYDMILGGTASNGLVAKTVKYNLHNTRFSE